MKLIVEVIYRDDKKEEFVCVAAPEIYDTFILIHLEGFRKEYLHKDGIARIIHYFKPA